jgi:hypothetical protein
MNMFYSFDVDTGDEHLARLADSLWTICEEQSLDVDDFETVTLPTAR